MLTAVLAAGTAAADEAASASATVILRAHGSTGSIEFVHAADREQVAGAIPRSSLRAELARGIGRFLQNVRTEAVLSHGHFVGWRLVSLFPKRPEVHVQGLQEGDVLLRVNGETIERPEDFKAVWDGLAGAKQLVLEIERAGQPRTLRYNIVDA